MFSGFITSRKKVSFEDLREMIRLQEEGLSLNKISKATGFSATTVSRYLRRYSDPLMLCLASAFRDASVDIENSMRELLKIEKKRRGFKEDKLVFVGMANVARYYWCAMKSLFLSRMNEVGFFASYLADRVRYSYKLKKIKLNVDRLPRTPEELLEVGNDITFEDVENLLKRRAEELERLPEELKRLPRMVGGLMSLLTGIKPEFESLSPKRRGVFLELEKAELYPTIRWNFSWGDYVVVGVPDGITDTFVYEFKSARSRFLANYDKPVAFTQADLYGYFFRRNLKRVQIYIIREDLIETWEEHVDRDNALETLKKFKSLDEGEKPRPPKEWKCNKCEFKTECARLGIF